MKIFKRTIISQKYLGLCRIKNRFVHRLKSDFLQIEKPTVFCWQKVFFSFCFEYSGMLKIFTLEKKIPVVGGKIVRKGSKKDNSM